MRGSITVSPCPCAAPLRRERGLNGADDLGIGHSQVFDVEPVEIVDIDWRHGRCGHGRPASLRGRFEAMDAVGLGIARGSVHRQVGVAGQGGRKAAKCESPQKTFGSGIIRKADERLP